MSPSRHLNWGTAPDTPPPRHPYRDTVVLYLVLAAIIVLVAWFTGGGVARAAAFAVAFFVIASTYSVWQWRKRLAEARRRAPTEERP